MEPLMASSSLEVKPPRELLFDSVYDIWLCVGHFIT